MKKIYLAFFSLFILFLASVYLTNACGKKSDDDEEYDPFESKIPKDWDGKSDWSGNVLKVSND